MIRNVSKVGNQEDVFNVFISRENPNASHR